MMKRRMMWLPKFNASAYHNRRTGASFDSATRPYAEQRVSPSGRSADKLDATRGETIDAAGDLDLLRRHCVAQDWCRRLQRRDGVENVLPGRVGKRIAGLSG